MQKIQPIIDQAKAAIAANAAADEKGGQTFLDSLLSQVCHEIQDAIPGGYREQLYITKERQELRVVYHPLIQDVPFSQYASCPAVVLKVKIKRHEQPYKWGSSGYKYTLADIVLVGDADDLDDVIEQGKAVLQARRQARTNRVATFSAKLAAAGLTAEQFLSLHVDYGALTYSEKDMLAKAVCK